MHKALIWDLDGTIADTQDLHANVESDLLGRYGTRISPAEVTQRYAGVRTADFFTTLLTPRGVTAQQISALMDEKWQRVGAERMHAMPGARELILEAHARNIPQAVGSASARAYVLAVLRSLQLEQCFSAIVGGDDVEEGKPSPQIFLKAADMLNVPAAHCVVIEDGRAGMLAASRAGMLCVGVCDRAPADIALSIQVKSLTDVRLDDVLALVPE